MKKIITMFSILIGLMSGTAYGLGLNSDINNVIVRSGINKGAISISVKDAKSGKTVFELNPKTPIPPASTQKVITGTAAFMTLGEDYKFSTKLYKNKENEYLLVLGADPYLTSKDLDKIVKFIPKEPKEINIDSSVIDKNDWGEGWQWDDALNPYMPKFSAYNLDKNLLEIVITPSKTGCPPNITKGYNYPITFINQITTDKITKYSMKCKNSSTPDIIEFEGTIKSGKSEIFDIPINNPKKYFNMKLSDIIINNNISSSGEYRSVKLDDNYKLVTQLSHDIDRAQRDVFKHSNNMVSETVFKLAGGKYASGTGSFDNGLLMFNDFCKKHHINTSNIKIVDASGVSKNNLMVSDFMTNFLISVQGYLESELPTAGEGTLSNRMLYLNGYVHAKTGTLNNISSIAGYIDSKKGQKYVFSIMINDPKSSSSDKKMLEEYILRTLYTKG